mmetsp:Transcript_5964/g.16676  ORF Transcript_5964/g.16676 Transcript_5964/m.16676 type:complete len:236 (-) Transcript_5964:15-722(-)
MTVILASLSTGSTSGGGPTLLPVGWLLMQTGLGQKRHSLSVSCLPPATLACCLWRLFMSMCRSWRTVTTSCPGRSWCGQLHSCDSPSARGCGTGNSSAAEREEPGGLIAVPSRASQGPCVLERATPHSPYPRCPIFSGVGPPDDILGDAGVPPLAAVETSRSTDTQRSAVMSPSIADDSPCWPRLCLAASSLIIFHSDMVESWGYDFVFTATRMEPASSEALGCRRWSTIDSGLP